MIDIFVFGRSMCRIFKRRCARLRKRPCTQWQDRFLKNHNFSIKLWNFNIYLIFYQNKKADKYHRRSQPARPRNFEKFFKRFCCLQNQPWIGRFRFSHSSFYWISVCEISLIFLNKLYEYNLFIFAEFI